MSENIWLILGAVAWLAIGWLPSRLMKHYFNTRFADVGGWDAWMEAVVIFYALGGPAGGLATILPWLDFTSDYPKGWQW